MPDVGQARPSRQPYIARPNDTHTEVLHAICVPLHAFGSRPTVPIRDVTGRRNALLASTAGSYVHRCTSASNSWVRTASVEVERLIIQNIMNSSRPAVGLRLGRRSLMCGLDAFEPRG